jgi:hypothetical protein
MAGRRKFRLPRSGFVHYSLITDSGEVVIHSRWTMDKTLIRYLYLRRL